MGEWHIEEVDGDNPIVWIDEHTYFVAEHDPSMIVNAHNADCAAYRAELARVKAESLRVVADECKNMDIASDWYMTLDGLGWLGYDRHNCECVETPHGYHKFDDCRKVKLERWEATE